MVFTTVYGGHHTRDLSDPKMEERTLIFARLLLSVLSYMLCLVNPDRKNLSFNSIFFLPRALVYNALANRTNENGTAVVIETKRNRNYALLGGFLSLITSAAIFGHSLRRNCCPASDRYKLKAIHESLLNSTPSLLPYSSSGSTGETCTTVNRIDQALKRNRPPLT